MSKARDHYESLLHESGRTDELVDSISFRIEDAESPLDRAEYLCERAALHRNVDRMDAASRDLRAVLQIEPHHGRALDLLELVYREKDDFRGLVTVWKRQLETAGDKPDAVRLNRAIGHTLLRQLNEAAEARVYLQKVAEMAPAFDNVRLWADACRVESDELAAFNILARFGLASEEDDGASLALEAARLGPSVGAEPEDISKLWVSALRRLPHAFPSDSESVSILTQANAWDEVENALLAAYSDELPGALTSLVVLYREAMADRGDHGDRWSALSRASSGANEVLRGWERWLLDRENWTGLDDLYGIWLESHPDDGMEIVIRRARIRSEHDLPDATELWRSVLDSDAEHLEAQFHVWRATKDLEEKSILADTLQDALPRSSQNRLEVVRWLAHSSDDHRVANRWWRELLLFRPNDHDALESFGHRSTTPRCRCKQSLPSSSKP